MGMAACGWLVRLRRWKTCWKRDRVRYLMREGKSPCRKECLLLLPPPWVHTQLHSSMVSEKDAVLCRLNEDSSSPEECGSPDTGT
jgi:hypothetical protein